MISNFVLVHSAWIGLFLLISLFALFASERLPPVILAASAGASMLVLGYLPGEDMEQVFANSAPITIAAMFVLSGALIRTGVVEALASAASRRAKRSPRLSIAEILGGTFSASALVNNTPVVIILIPIIRKVAEVTRISAKRLLIPLSYLSIMGGTLTLVGTSTNLLVDGIAQREGEPAFGIFELTQVGLIAAAAGVAFLLLAGRFLLPDGHESDGKADAEPPLENRFLTELRIDEDSDLVGTKYTALPMLTRSGVSLSGFKRGRLIERKPDENAIVETGDRVLLAAEQTELLMDGILPAHGCDTSHVPRKNHESHICNSGRIPCHWIDDLSLDQAGRSETAPGQPFVSCGRIIHRPRHGGSTYGAISRVA